MPEQNNDTQDLKDILALDRPRKKWPRRLIVIGAVLVLGAAGWWGLRPAAGDAPRVSYLTAPLVNGDLEVIVSATGTLEPVNQVDVGTEVSGTIRSVLVDFNAPVKKGQVLALLDTTKLEAQRDQARATLAVAKAELENTRAAAKEAKINLERLERAYELSKGRLPSLQDLDAARAAHDKTLAQVAVAKATIAKSEASLKAYETDLGKAIIQAPIDGMILDRQVELGQTVAASLSAPVLFTMAENLANMELCVSVDEADVGRVKEGQRASFVVDAYPDRRFPAKITQVRFAPQTENGVVTYDCILAVDNSDLLLRPGMTATADIVAIEVKDAVLAPNMALRFKPSGPAQTAADGKGDQHGFLAKLMPGPPRRPRGQKQTGGGKKDKARPKVWVLEDGRPVARPVTTGPSDGVNTQIVSGEVRPGQEVIIGQEESGQ